MIHVQRKKKFIFAAEVTFMRFEKGSSRSSYNTHVVAYRSTVYLSDCGFE